MIGTGGDDTHAVDALHLRPFPGGRPDLIFGPKASDNRGFEIDYWLKGTLARNPEY
jgi:hypothetical protein